MFLQEVTILVYKERHMQYDETNRVVIGALFVKVPK